MRDRDGKACRGGGYLPGGGEIRVAHIFVEVREGGLSRSTSPSSALATLAVRIDTPERSNFSRSYGIFF